MYNVINTLTTTSATVKETIMKSVINIITAVSIVLVIVGITFVATLPSTSTDVHFNAAAENNNISVKTLAVSSFAFNYDSTYSGTISVWTTDEGMTTMPCIITMHGNDIKLVVDGNTYTGYSDTISSDNGTMDVEKLHLVK